MTDYNNNDDFEMSETIYKNKYINKTYKVKYTERDFLIRVLKVLSDSAPIDVLDSEFGQITLTNDMRVSQKRRVSYSCSNNGQAIFNKILVDLSVATNDFDEFAFECSDEIQNYGDEESYKKRELEHLNNIDYDYNEKPLPVDIAKELDKQMYKKIKESIHNDDNLIIDDVEVVYTEIITVPKYSVTFTYKGEKYENHAYAIGEFLGIDGDYLKTKYGKAKEETAANFQKKEDAARKAAKTRGIISALLLFVAPLFSIIYYAVSTMSLRMNNIKITWENAWQSRLIAILIIVFAIGFMICDWVLKQKALTGSYRGTIYEKIDKQLIKFGFKATKNGQIGQTEGFNKVNLVQAILCFFCVIAIIVLLFIPNIG